MRKMPDSSFFALNTELNLDDRWQLAKTSPFAFIQLAMFYNIFGI